MEKLIHLLYHKATNRSKAKGAEETTGNTPKLDEQVKDSVSEIDVAFNLQYNTISLKVFYLNRPKKSYKLDIPIKDLQHILDKLGKAIEEPESIFDIKIDDDNEFDIER